MAANMSTTKTFHLFPLLPTELRQQIWCQALLAPAVWFATLREDLGQQLKDQINEAEQRLISTEGLTAEDVEWPEWDPEVAREYMVLKPIGPVPSTAAGFACTEARREMESLIPHPWRVGANRQVCWIHWETAVIHLGRFDNAIRFNISLDDHEIAWFRHVAFECPGWRRQEAKMVTQSLAHRSPDLCTLIVHMRAIHNAETEREQAQAQAPFPLLPDVLEPELTPSARTASLYMRRSILKPTRSEISEARVTSQPDQGAQWNRLGRQDMWEAFDDAGRELYTPRIHILHLDPARY